MNYKKGIFFHNSNSMIYKHCGVLVENIHKPIRRKERNIKDLKFDIQVNKNFYMSWSSFIKKAPVKSNSADPGRKIFKSLSLELSDENFQKNLEVNKNVLKKEKGENELSFVLTDEEENIVDSQYISELKKHRNSLEIS